MTDYPWDQHQVATRDPNAPRSAIWKADVEGKKIHGRIVEIWTNRKDDESTPVINLTTADGEAWSIWVSQFVLRRKIADLAPQVGDTITVRYDGSTKIDAGKTLKEFTVAVNGNVWEEPVDLGPVSTAPVPAAVEGVPSDEPF